MESEIKLHYQSIRRVLLIVLLLNWGVAVIKIVFGVFSKCQSMTADGFHSLSDGTSNIIGFIGLYFCSQPKDEDHPYGHKKYETLFALGIAVLLFFVAFNLAKEGIKRFMHPVMPQISAVSFIVMIITLGINIWVMVYEYKKGKMLKSDILVVDSLHTRADIFTSVSVIFALVFIKIGFPVFDPIITILISVFIGHTAFEIVKQESGILCDAVAMPDVKKIEDIVLNIEGVKSCHKIRSRGRPDDIHIDLHIQASPNMHLIKAHEISGIVEEKIKKEIPQVTDVLVHIEPLDERIEE
jgi:cation diffusion facilitator family transporter